MTTAAKISIQIDAQTATLQKGFGEAKQAISSLQSSMSGSMASGMLKANVAIAAVQGALGSLQGAISSVRGAMGELDAQNKMAARLGADADQLVALGFAADLAGSSTDSLNKALEKMQNNLGEALAGNATAAQSFAQIGLSVEELKGLSADQVFAKVAEQIQLLGDDTKATKVALDLFGKAGGELLPLLKGGAEGLNEMGKQAQEMGLLFGDNRKMVEAANDAIDSMKRAWGTFVQQIAILVAPALKSVADMLTTIVSAFNRLMGSATGATAPFKEFSSEAKKAAFDIKDMAAAAKEAEAARKKLVDQGADVTKSMRTPVEVYRDSLAELNKLVTKGVISWTTYTRAAKKAMQDILATRNEISDFKTPGIGAVTRSSAAGFSAVQEASRAKQDADRRHRETLAWLAKIEAATRGSVITFAPVNI